ncbi:hypothetical protein CMI47_12985 [Candidatus Pacearchaeota archaeon]|nr:hypothetical protein [Candidatus Pacearchaeota archaeon]|tara:strand:- start:1047 stop:1262 length:216 start_codon:yes stop_codon:yes gene_type:complete
MYNKIIGKCSICEGYVTVPQVWWGVIPPVPTCEECGAIKDSDLPVIKMKLAPQTWLSAGTTITSHTSRANE